MTRPLALLLFAAPALASGGEGAHGAAPTWLGVPMWVWQSVNLAVFLFLLVYFLRRPLAKFFAGRRQEIDAALKKAEEDRARAEETTRTLAARLEELQAELERMRAKAAQEAEAEHAALLAQAQRDAERVVERARGEMDARVRAARKELTAYTGDLAVRLAKEILARGVTAEDQRRLLDEGVVALSASGAGKD